ncbi:hypothetical protein [Gordonia alkanivorans]|uniref:hypothetical protein n=1 Tax=Gordonia alkanivorans TaxID=84096 RepID=UPI0004BBD59B|nr:hypothetical protein [Gordonia alkanivorans]
MSTQIPEPALVALRSTCLEANRHERFVNPRLCAQACTVLDRRGERWAAAVLGRALDHRSVAVPTRPYLVAGELQTLVAADAEEDRHAIAHLG